MSAQDQHTDIDAAIPQHPDKRDLLGNFCFYFHFAVMIFIVSGWLYPWHAALYVYLGFIPLVILQWQVNKSSCILNNIESWARTGRWRSPENKEEGAWFLNMIKDVTGITLQPWQANAINYGVVIALWCAGLLHLNHWQL